MKQNLTIPLDEALIQKARVIATYHAMTLQHFLSEEVTRLIEQFTSNQDSTFMPIPTLDHSVWPLTVRELAGAWTDLPTAEEIRNDLTEDSPREPL